MGFILWIIAVLLIIFGIVKLVEGLILFGIILILLGLLIGPFVSHFSTRNRY